MKMEMKKRSITWTAHSKDVTHAENPGDAEVFLQGLSVAALGAVAWGVDDLDMHLRGKTNAGGQGSWLAGCSLLTCHVCFIQPKSGFLGVGKNEKFGILLVFMTQNNLVLLWSKSNSTTDSQCQWVSCMQGLWHNLPQSRTLVNYTTQNLIQLILFRNKIVSTTDTHARTMICNLTVSMSLCVCVCECVCVLQFNKGTSCRTKEHDTLSRWNRKSKWRHAVYHIELALTEHCKAVALRLTSRWHGREQRVVLQSNSLTKGRHAVWQRNVMRSDNGMSWSLTEEHAVWQRDVMQSWKGVSCSLTKWDVKRSDKGMSCSLTKRDVKRSDKGTSCNHQWQSGTSSGLTKGRHAVWQRDIMWPDKRMSCGLTKGRNAVWQTEVMYK